MKKIFNWLGGLVLVAIFIVPLLYAGGVVSESVMKAILLAGTILWFIVMLPHMRGRSGGVGLLIAAGLAFSGSTGFAASVPVVSGDVGYVNAENGDSMWDATYHSAPNFQGNAQTQFERMVGEGISRVQSEQFSAVWSATLSARKDGVYRFTLKSSEPSSAAVDGGNLITLTSAGEATANLQMHSGAPVEIAVRLPAATAATKTTLEWEFIGKSQEIADVGTPSAAGIVSTLSTKIGASKILENSRFKVEVAEDGAFEVIGKKSGEQALFQPEFIVVARATSNDPKYQSRGARFSDEGPVGNTNYFVPVWDKNPDYFAAAQPRWLLRPSKMTAESDQIVWTFENTKDFQLEARLSLPADGSEPILAFRLTPMVEAFFSVGFAGAPKVAMESAGWIWQPLVWTGRRFPNMSYLTPEYQCPIPFAMAAIDGASVGVGADPKEMPFRMPLGEDSRFGVMVRNAEGQAQPLVFAPILGGVESKRNSGQVYDFALRLFVGTDDWYESYRTLARGLYDFGDQRENALGSLNETIENMTEFFLHEEFSYWNPKHKSWGYQNDLGPEGIRQQSAAYPFSLAMVLDSPEVLHKRAIPTLEYMLTRNRSTAKSSDTDLLGGPNKVSLDYIPTHRLLGERNGVLRQVAADTSPVILKGEPREISNPRGTITEDRLTLLHALAMYRLTDETRWLDRAKVAADRYIEDRVKPPVESFADAQSSFWTELSAAYDGLYELYEETGDKRYLDAAHAAIGEFTAYVYLAPPIPDAPFLANPGGQHRGVKIAEESVPAWRVSPNGLTAECAATAHSHRGIFMAPYAGYMLRVAAGTDDEFLREIARSSTVGRYMNYPTYAYRHGLTTIFEKPDHPLRSFEEIKKITSAHYNHPLPMTAFLVDYLVSDVADRSGGKIDFPSEYTNTGAYFRTKVYGASAGRFFEDSNVFLWMPAQLIQTGSVQLNYVSARGNDSLYVALSNQSNEPVDTWIQVNPKLVELPGTRSARAWLGGTSTEPISVTDGRAQVTVPAKGLLSIAIPDVTVKTRVQEAMLDPEAPRLPDSKSATFKTHLGDVRVTPLTYGRGLTMVHVIVVAGAGDIGPVTLRHSAGGEEAVLTASEYPYEFTIPVPDSLAKFEFVLDSVRADGMKLSSGATSVQLR